MSEEVTGTSPEAPAMAAPIIGRATGWTRWRTMAGVGLAMMLHDRIKLLGTLAGVFFAVILTDQQAGTFLGLLDKNTMFVEHSGADVWIVPPDTKQLIPGKALADTALYIARGSPGVAWAEPLLYGIADVALPSGGSEEVSLSGSEPPRFAGGPWNLVAGTKEVLRLPDAVVFEDSQREKLGGINLGSLRELNGRRVRAAGFTWGLLPFAPPYAFANAALARTILHVPPGRVSFVLVGVEPGLDPAAVAAAMQKRLPEVEVITRTALQHDIVVYLLTKTALGISFATSTLFGLFIGLVIVSLSMFSSVIDNIRQFGTLKALGTTTSDLAKLLAVQSLIYGLTGSLIGLTAILGVAAVTRSPSLALILPPAYVIGTVFVMVVLCVFASALSLLRLRKVEPAMVFR